MLRQENLNQVSFDTRFRHEQYGANIFDRLSVDDADMKNSDIISQIIRMHHQKEQKKNSDIDIIKIDDMMGDKDMVYRLRINPKPAHFRQGGRSYIPHRP